MIHKSINFAGAKRVGLFAHKRSHQIAPPDHTGEFWKNLESQLVKIAKIAPTMILERRFGMSLSELIHEIIHWITRL